MASPTTAPLVIYALPGSQFVFKVLTALTSRNIEHYVQPVPLGLKKRKTFIPSGGILVPELQVGSGDTKVIVSDSEKILHWLDENRGTNFFPNEQAKELSGRASDSVLAASVWYYNWVDDDGYTRSMRASIGGNDKLFPWFVPWFVVDLVLSSTRTKFRNQVKEALKLNDQDLDDGPGMKQRLLEELKFFNGILKDEDDYFLPGEKPTAPDFSVYCQLERLVGGTGVSDVEIPAALPELKEECDASLARLWKWHDNIRKTCHCQFRGKKCPPELLE